MPPRSKYITDLNPRVVSFYQKMESQHFIASIQDLSDMLDIYRLICYQHFPDSLSTTDQLSAMWDAIKNYCLYFVKPDRIHPKCNYIPRKCLDCGIEYIGVKGRCHRCHYKRYSSVRICVECGKKFKGAGLRCHKCYQINREYL